MSGPAPNLALNAEWDLDFDGANLAVVSGSDAARQGILCRLKMVRGEWALDESLGIPYFTEILGVKNPSLGAIRALIRGVVSRAPGVASCSVSAVEVDGASRTATVRVIATYDDGTTEDVSMTVGG